MASRPHRAVSIKAEGQPAKPRAAAWDTLTPSELAFDFTARAAPSSAAKPQPGAKQDEEKVGVKEAIIRWLEEQL